MYSYLFFDHVMNSERGKMLLRLSLVFTAVFFIACSGMSAIAITDIKHSDTGNNFDSKYVNSDSTGNKTDNFSLRVRSLFEFKDLSYSEVLSSMQLDRIVMNFYPKYYLERPTLPGKTLFQHNSNDKTNVTYINPVIAEINGTAIRADSFTSRMFQRHREWFELFIKELFVETVAKKEAEKEGIVFPKKYLEDANKRVLSLLKQRARKEGKSFKKNWKDQGFETYRAYVDMWRRYTEKMILLSHVINATRALVL